MTIFTETPSHEELKASVVEIVQAVDITTFTVKDLYKQVGLQVQSKFGGNELTNADKQAIKKAVIQVLEETQRRQQNARRDLFDGMFLNVHI